MKSPIVLIADPVILSIPVLESGEPMVDIRHEGLLHYGPSPEIPDNTDYTKMRLSVYEKLLAAQRNLPQGLSFCLYEGYRSLQLQKHIFDTLYDKVCQRHPDWTSEQLFNETTKLVSPVVNFDGSKNIPPHATGAAIDVYLIDTKGNPLDMGIHPKAWMEDAGGVLSLTQSDMISPEAKKHRVLMGDVLRAEGFVNYPTEYWHWSYGDKYWAYCTDSKSARYGLFA